MVDWKQTLLQPGNTIRTAMACMEDSGLRVVLVTDESRVLRGIVTDGDIRRAILDGYTLDDPVTQVMTDEPVVLQVRESREAILSLMREKHLLHIPLVDDRKRVVDLAVMEHMIGSEPLPNSVVLMAGGLGTRLLPLTRNCPKPLLEIGGQPILEIILERFIEVGFRRFYLSVNYMSQMIEEHFGDGSKWGVDISYLYEDKRLGTAGSLSLLSKVQADPLIVMNGDVLTRLDFKRLLDFHQDRGVSATMCVRDYDVQIPFGVVQVQNDLVSQIEEKPVHRHFLNAGIYVLEPEVLSYVPQNTFFDMPDLFRHLIEDARKVSAFPIQEYWTDVGHHEDFQKAQDEFAQVFVSKRAALGRVDNQRSSVTMEATCKKAM